MHTVLEMPIQSLDMAALQEMQAKYPDAVLKVETVQPLQGGRMDEAHFWAIIALFDWKQTDPEAIITPAAIQLSVFDIADIERFYEILAEKLYALDGKVFAENVGSNRYSETEDKYFSVDDFLYSRCAVIARGRDFYKKVLHDPTKMPKEFTFESILYLPHRAYEKKTGRNNFQYVTPVWYETFSNSDGWPGTIPLKDFISNEY